MRLEIIVTSRSYEDNIMRVKFTLNGVEKEINATSSRETTEEQRTHKLLDSIVKEYLDNRTKYDSGALDRSY
jgi:cell division protein FtsB